MKSVINDSGFFKEHYAKFRKAVPEKDLKSFSSLKTDADRWKFVRDRHKTPFPEGGKGGAKNLNEAINMKNAGNKCFQEGKYANALALYTQSLLLFPSDGDKTELSIIRANRSAALYHLEEYEVALADIEHALSVGYPKHLRHKVMDRKARCLMGLKQNKTAIQALRDTITALDDAKMPAEARQKKQQDVQIMLGLMAKNRAFDGTINPSTRMLPLENKKSGIIKSVITGDRNPKYKAASAAVTFGYSEHEGRYAEAASGIQPGDVILRENPHCAVLLQENATTHCFQCMKRVYFGEPCPTCTLVRYCSSQCQELATKTHHRFECKILKRLWESGASITCLMAIRIITQRPLSYFVDFNSKQQENGNADVNMEKYYNGNDYSTVYGLVRHEEKRPTEDMFHRTYMAVFLHECLKQSGYFSGDMNEQDRLKAEGLVAGLILRHLQSLQFNAHEISETIFTSSEPQNWKSIFIGAGLFPTLALFNHSCEPSIIRYFEGSKVVVRAIKSIKSGEQISENYGPIFTQTPKRDRQSTLKNQYWFDCACEPCTRNWPMLEQMDTSTMRFHCDNKQCDNVVIVPINTGSFMVQCNKCNQMTNILKGLKMLQDSDSLFRLGESFLKTGEILKALRKFLELQALLSDTLVPPFKDFYLCQQNVRNCMMALGNTHPPLENFSKQTNATK